MERMHEPAGRRSGCITLTTSAAAAGARATCAARFARLLHEGRLHDALGYLNDRTRYRFTGLYRADAPLLRNVGLFDRENPDLDASGAVTNLDETYSLCHAGVSIRLANGRSWGTLCHFDLRPRLLSADEVRALQTVAPVVTAWLAKSPQPSERLEVRVHDEAEDLAR